MTTNLKSYAFVLDSEGKKLSPTPENKAWFLIRKKRAKLINKFPMVIQLTKIVSTSDTEIKDWIIKPMRRQSKGSNEEVCGFKHRDLVRYTKRDGSYYDGYITALYPKKNQFNLTDFNGKTYKRYGLKNASLLWRFDKIYYI